MVKYTAKDIIKRALQLADLENSDFIGDEEKIALLNESFNMLYQKIVNAGDKTWLKKVYAHNGMYLPADFYQLTGLYIESSKEQIPRINDGQQQGYEIQGNRIYLAPCYDTSNVVFEYAPVPPTVSLKEKRIGCPYASPVAADANAYVRDGTNGTVIIQDIDSTYTWAIDRVTYDEIAMYSNGVLARKGTSLTFYKYDGEETLSLSGVPFIERDILYRYDRETGAVYELDGDVYYKSVPVTVDTDTMAIYKDMGSICQIGEEGYRFNTFDRVSYSGVKMQCVQMKDVYAVDYNGRLWKLTPSEMVQVETEFPAVCVTSKKYVVTKKAFGSSYWLEGLRDDSLLDYPNNLFWVVLSYMLAIQFKVKQGADVSQLNSLYNDAMGQFFDSISRDANADTQIKNVYGSHRLYCW